MGEFVRLFGRSFPQNGEGRQVESLRVRVQAAVPAGATVRVADVQCQPGSLITGWTLHSADLGLVPVDGWQLRNGVFRGPQRVVVAADVASASPLRVDLEPLKGAAPVQVGGYLFGEITTAARLDGLDHTATQGAGLPPHLTARTDADLELQQPAGARSRMLVWFRGIVTVEADDPALPSDPPETVPDPAPDPGLDPVPGEPDPNDPDPPEGP